MGRTYKRQKGGKILGAGADGCIFSEAAFPCSNDTDISGYDVSDPKFVAKMVPNSDNENKIIAIAKSILTGPDAKFLLTNYGSCTPANYRITDAKKRAAFDENMAALENQSPDPDGNACEKLASQYPPHISSLYKILVNSRYKNDLFHYILQNEENPTLIVRVITAAIAFSSAIKKLATNNGSKLVNVDLHSGNIFVNYDIINGPLTIGMADFGRCAYQDKNLDSATNSMTWNTYFMNYMTEFHIEVGFPHIPIECRLFATFIRSTHHNTIVAIINRLSILIQKNQEFTDPRDPFYYSGKLEYLNLIQKFSPFITHVLKWGSSSTEEKFAIMNFILYRFNTVGFLGNFISTLSITREFQNEMSKIRIAIKKYSASAGNIDEFKTDNMFHRIVKFYYDELTRPYNSDFTNIIDVAEAEKNYNFPSAFAIAMNIHIPPGPPVAPLHPSRSPPPIPGTVETLKKGGRLRRKQTMRKRR